MVLFFASPIGLGHATRDIAICEELKSLSREKISVITGSPAYDIFVNYGYSAENVYNPVQFDIDSSMQLHSRLKWLLNYFMYYRRCKQIASGFVDRRDDLIVSDEDFASIAIGEKKDRKRVLITDLLETHFVSGMFAALESRMNKSMQNMLAKCNRVIIPDFGEDVDNISYVGPIVRKSSISDRDQLRKKLGIEKRTILISIGGTSAGRHIIEKALIAYNKLRSEMDLDLLVATGPSVSKFENNQTDYRNIGFVDNLHEFIYASDLVVSLAGRSTIDESRVYGTPGIFIPIKGHFEQEQNASRVGYSYEDISRLETLMRETIEKGRSNNPKIQNGAQIAAKIIMKMI
ncbi:MAG TPA: glycosyltransferase [Nitrososphaeraceae archaeon]|jgi:UDP-N-acetylglucosamine--N-acetylmuramyl-(pentapeptide) pyrophosphoryl-undecaprenol N-acetylglucosamine transferase|nr:glycosyltransferase [Nitrososphaeraceae archaeon]